MKKEQLELESKTAFVAIVGKPNVGKSSLLNALVAEKVAIVSSRPQTTRTKITGVITKGPIQYVFIDTPGLHHPRTKLSEYMVNQVNESVADVDVALLVVEPGKDIHPMEQKLMENFSALGLSAMLIINKIDLVENKESLLAVIQRYTQAFDFDAVLPISVQENDGVSHIFPELEKYASPSPHFFPEDAMTDQPERIIVAEILREKLLCNLYDELPHGTAVSVESMKERPDSGILDIQATIYCEKASHKGMIIGKGGQMLKTIATQARADIEGFLDVKVNLQCWVKVKDDWRNNEQVLRTLGYS